MKSSLNLKDLEPANQYQDGEFVVSGEFPALIIRFKDEEQRKKYRDMLNKAEEVLVNNLELKKERKNRVKV